MSEHEIIYDSQGRMKYNPDFHHNQGKPWTVTDENYLIEHYEALGPETLSYSLGRTFTTIANRAYELRKAGKMPKRSRKSNNAVH